MIINSLYINLQAYKFSNSGKGMNSVKIPTLKVYCLKYYQQEQGLLFLQKPTQTISSLIYQPNLCNELIAKITEADRSIMLKKFRIIFLWDQHHEGHLRLLRHDINQIEVLDCHHNINTDNLLILFIEISREIIRLRSFAYIH